VVVQLLVGVGANLATGVGLLEVLVEGRIVRHEVLEVAVLLAVLDHHDLAVALDDLGLDLAHLLVAQDVDGELAVDDLLTDLRDAPRTQRVGLTRPAERRLGLLVGLQKGFVRPAGNEGVGLVDAVEGREDTPGRPCCVAQPLFRILDRLVHVTTPSLFPEANLQEIGETRHCPDEALRRREFQS